MEKKIDIIVPCTRGLNDIERLLNSINKQSIKNLCVVNLIKNSNFDYYKFICEYKDLTINVFETEKKLNAGECRQFGIDNTNLPYIIFIDDDDKFHDSESISILYNEMISSDCDVVKGKVRICYSDSYNDIMDGCLLHGRLYKREILKKYNLSFPSDLVYCEDVYFNGIINHFNRINYVESVVYDFNRCNTDNLMSKEKNIKLKTNFYNYYINYLVQKKIDTLINTKTNYSEFFINTLINLELALIELCIMNNYIDLLKYADYIFKLTLGQEIIYFKNICDFSTRNTYFINNKKILQSVFNGYFLDACYSEIDRWNKLDDDKKQELLKKQNFGESLIG